MSIASFNKLHWLLGVHSSTRGPNNGYLDHFPKPAGFTMYTDLMPGSESFGMMHEGLEGLTTTDDWGDGPSNMSLQLADPDFSNMALAIGLDMKDGHEKKVTMDM